MKRRASARVASFALAAVLTATPLVVGVGAASASAAEISGAITNVSVLQESAGIGSRMRVDIAWAVPAGTAANDIFTLTLPAELRATEGFTFALKDPATGAVVANAKVQGQTVVFTLTDYVQTHANVKGTAYVMVGWNKEIVKPGETVTTTFTVEGKTFTDTVVVPDPGTGTPKPEDPTKVTETTGKWMGYNQPNGTAPMQWGIRTATFTKDQVGNPVTVIDTPSSPGHEIDCSKVGAQVFWRSVDDKWHWIADITNSTPATSLICTPTKATLTTVVQESWVGNSLELYGRSKVTDATQTVFTNAGTVKVANTSQPVEARVRWETGGGTASGVGSVSVGDYVWLDANRDGVQDAGEKGIPGVQLTLVGPDGKPVTNVNGKVVGPTTTDSNGKYSFAKLPILPAGSSYTVTIDSSSPALSGLLPTLTGQGTRANDSSTGSATSGDLTVSGDSDLTLDFGFYAKPSQPQPPVTPPVPEQPQPPAQPQTPTETGQVLGAVLEVPVTTTVTETAPVAAPAAVLAKTGAESNSLAAVGGGLLVAGSVLLLLARRRQPEHTSH